MSREGCTVSNWGLLVSNIDPKGGVKSDVAAGQAGTKGTEGLLCGNSLVDTGVRLKSIEEESDVMRTTATRHR